MGAAKIKTFVRVEPKIYAYKTPGVTYHEDWIKIGYTDKQTVEERVRQQTHTAGVRAEIQWDELARYTKDPKEFFTDRNFHRFLPSTWALSGKREPNGLSWMHKPPMSTFSILPPGSMPYLRRISWNMNFAGSREMR